MLVLTSALGHYQLDDNQPQKGKFGGFMPGIRQNDHLKVAAKRIAPTNNAEELRKLDIIQQLRHKTLAPTIDVIHNSDAVYLIRPFIEGTSFKAILKKSGIRKQLGASFMVKAMVHLLNGLQLMHDNGLIHRDIKPSNIIIGHPSGQSPKYWQPENVVLIDFEQACLYPIANRARSPFALVYSPPEQLLNHNWLVSPQSDLFALTITMFEMLTGSAPWVDCNAEILMNLQLTYPMKRPSGIDEPLFEILAKAGYKEPFPLPPKRLAPEVIEDILKRGIAKRYTSAKEMITDLQNYLLQHPQHDHRSLWQRITHRK
jgi:serine/threonine protein kinase